MFIFDYRGYGRSEGAGHNDTYSVGVLAYYQALGEFIDNPPKGDG